MLFFSIDFNFNSVMVREYACMTQIFKNWLRCDCDHRYISSYKGKSVSFRLKRWILVGQPFKRLDRWMVFWFIASEKEEVD